MISIYTTTRAVLAAWDSTVLPVANDGRLQEAMEELRHSMEAQPAYTYASTQATKCAGCGQHKHTPLRIDAMDGYVCLTCIDQKLGSLLGEFGYPPPATGLVDEVLAELAKAVAKFPTWPTDPLHALAVLGEEFGELTKDVLQLCYEPHKTTPESARKEAMQTAAMALRFAMSLARYEYRPGPQHAQGEAR